jgi:hypothetical protein
MAASPDELEKKLKEIEKLAAQLGTTFNTLNLRPVLNNALAIESTFNDLTRRVQELEDGSDYLVSNFKKLVGEIGKSNEGIKATQSGFKSLGSLAEQLVNYQRGYNDLSSEDIRKIEKKINIEKSRLDLAKRILEEEEADLKIQLRQAKARGENLTKIQGLLDQNIRSQKQINDLTSGNNSDLIQTYNLLEKSQQQAKLFEKTMGLTGAAAGALKGVLNTLGLGKIGEALGLDKAFEAATEKAKELSNARLKSLADEKKLKEQIQNLEDSLVKKVNQIGYFEAQINNLKSQGVAIDDPLIKNKQKIIDFLKAQEKQEKSILQAEQDRLKEVEKTNNQYSLFGDRFKVLTTYFKEAGKGLLKTFTDPLFYIHQILDAFKSLDDGIGQFAKGMNMSYRDAAKLNNEFNNIANSSMDVAVTTKGIRETMLAMGQAMGTNATLNAKDAVTMTKLREQAGFTNDELAKMQELTLATGGNLEDNTKNLLGAASITAMNNGVLLNEKEIMRDVAKASDATKLSLGGSTEALGKAAAQSKALGMSLEQVNNIADSLLQIESSISNELEAELLTGKNLNLEQARLYALNNDIEGLSKEIAKNYGTAAEFSKMNRIQQEAAAKAVGMTREELAGTLVRAEALKSMSGEQAEKAKQAFDTRVKEVGLEQAQKELKDGQLQKMMEQQSIQERFNQSIEKLKEVFVSLLAPLMPVLDIFAMILKPVGMIAGFIGEITGGLGKMLSYADKIVGVFLIYKGIQMASAVFDAAKTAQLALQGNAMAIQNIMLEKSLVKKAMYHSIAIKEAILDKGTVSLKEYFSALEEKSLVRKIGMGILNAKEFVQTKATALWEGIKLGYLTTANTVKKIGAAIEKGNLLKSIGDAAMKAISSLSSIPIVGWALGLAAAGTVAALGYKFLAGDDVVSPGYGKRTLMGPEGAIALNDKDTVIAGTNLFDKKGDDVVSEPEKITEFKSEGAISATSGGIQIDYNALASAVVSALKNAPMTVNSTLMLDKDVLAKQTVQAVSDNATKVGTAAAVGTSKI